MKKKHNDGKPMSKNIGYLLLMNAMRSVIFLLLVLNNLCALPLIGQDRINLEIRQAALKEVFDGIQEHSNYTCFYNDEVLKIDRRFSLRVRNATIESILDEAFSGIDLVYEIIGKQILITKKNTDGEPSTKVTQDVVKGIVTDEKGAPLPGVTVMVEGTTHGTTTNAEGVFRIMASEGDVLVFTFVGMTPSRITLETLEIKVVMHEDVTTLENVVVTGYQNIKKSTFTGAASSVVIEDIVQAGVPEVSRMLEGKVAGVSLQNVSGTFGTGPKITIRGASSIYGETRPLWVVDGVVLENIVDVSADELSSGNATTAIASSIAGLNTDDIASIEVLKDASATSLYGSRAMNGVVVVTTKSGSKGSLSVNYSGQFSINLKPSYNSYNILNSQDQMSVLLEMEEKGNLNYTKVLNGRNGGIFYRYYKGLSELNDDGSFVTTNTSQGLGTYLQQYEKVNTDWFDELFNNSLSQIHSISLSSGGEKSKVYASTSYYTDPGWSVANNSKRVTTNVNTDFQLNKKASFGVLSNLSLRKQKLPGTFSRTVDVVNGAYERDFDVNPFSYALNTSRASRLYDDDGDYEYYRMNWTDFNIMEEVQNNYINLDVLDTKLQMDFSYDFNDHLRWQALANGRYVKTTQEHIITENSNAANAYRSDETTQIQEANVYLYDDPDDAALPYSVLPYGGFYLRDDIVLQSYYIRNTLDFNKVYANRHEVNIFAGQELRYVDRDFSSYEGVGIQYDKGNTVYVDPDFYAFRALTNTKPFSLDYERERYVSFFSRINYTYNDKYIFSVTGRYDGSNKVGGGKSARWLPTANVGVAWNLMEEAFVQDIKSLSQLKLRATYGLTANLGIADNSSAVFRSSTTVRRDANNVENYIYIDALENAELTWEKQHEFNVGVDLGLWSNRITLITDVYFRNGYDLIDYVETSGIGGEATKAANFADMKTRGIELTLNTRNFVEGDFLWTSTFILGYNKQRITRLENTPRVIDLVTSNGGALLNGPQRGIYSIPFAGLDSNGIPTFYDETGEVVQSVNFQSTDVDFLKYEGRVSPNLTMGLTNRLRYHNLELELFFSYQGGNVIRLDPIFSASYSDLTVFTKEFKDRWLMAGDEEKTNVPVILSNRQEDQDSDLTVTYNNYNYSSARVAKGDFLRLKTVGLTYYFEDQLLKKLSVNTLSMQVQAVNPWLVFSDDKLHGQDPEFFRSGGVAYPITQAITYTLRVGF